MGRSWRRTFAVSSIFVFLMNFLIFNFLWTKRERKKEKEKESLWKHALSKRRTKNRAAKRREEKELGLVKQTKSLSWFCKLANREMDGWKDGDVGLSIFSMTFCPILRQVGVLTQMRMIWQFTSKQASMDRTEQNCTRGLVVQQRALSHVWLVNLNYWTNSLE